MEKDAIDFDNQILIYSITSEFLKYLSRIFIYVLLGSGKFESFFQLPMFFQVKTIFIELCLDRRTLQGLKFCIVAPLHFGLFIALCMIAVDVDTQVDYTYFSKYDSSVNFQILATSGCVDLQDFAFARRNNMNGYFLWTKCLVVYYSLIIIAMVYTWHRTVRFSSCILALFIVILFIFGTDYILYFHRIRQTSPMVCGILAGVFLSFEIFMPHNHRDPLSRLCGHDIPIEIRYEFLRNDLSAWARFYRWAKEMKRQWNIEEEKLIVTTVVGIITGVSVFILCVYVLYP